MVRFDTAVCDLLPRCATLYMQVMNEEEWERHRRSGLRHRPRPWLL